MRNFIAILLLCFYQLTVAAPQFLYFNASYFVEDNLFTIKNLPLNQEQIMTDHFKIKIERSDSTFSLKIQPIIPFVFQSCNVIVERPPFELFFANGFQSWTLSKWYQPNEKIPKISSLVKNKLKYYGDYDFWYKIAYNDKHPRSYYFTILQKEKDKIDFFTSLNDYVGYTIFEPLNNQQLAIHKEVEGLEMTKSYELFQLYFQLNTTYTDIRAFWLRQAKQEPAPPVMGWTSWYYHYTNISEPIVLENLDAFKNNKLAIDYVQVDDGWQRAVGDWFPNGKFTKNIKDLTDDIHLRKFKAGLWIAPFIVAKNSSIYKERKDWLLYHEGKPIKVGYNPLWGGVTNAAFFALDIYHPEVQVFLRKTLKMATQQWSFDLLKLDFLYAVAAVPYNGKTRSMIMHDALRMLNAWKGKAKILACGVPIAPAFFQTDYCRIGPDVGLNWDTQWMKSLKNLERISTLNSLHNTLNRSILNPHSLAIDPDVVILRNNKNKLKNHQKNTLFYVNHLLGQLAFTSDNPYEWTENQLHTYQKALPHQPQHVTHLRYDDGLYILRLNNEYLLLVNLGKKKVEIEIRDSLCFESISAKILKKGDVLTLAYAQSALLQTIDTEQDVSFAASTGYLLPGKEIDAIAINMDEQTVSVSIKPQIQLKTLILKIPSDWNQCTINGIPAEVFIINGVKLAQINF